MPVRTEVELVSAGVTLRAQHCSPGGAAPRPLVVMGPGMGATVDSGLIPLAEGLADAGIEALAVDYRGWGRSDGSPRQVLNLRKQQDDMRAAIRFGLQLPGVDRTRVIVWGHSLGGGNAFDLNATEPLVAASIHVFPATSALTLARHAAKPAGPIPPEARRAMLGDLVAGVTGGQRRYVPLVAGPEVNGLPDALEIAEHHAGPSWRNEINGSYAFELLTKRTLRLPRRARKPMLVQLGSGDRWVPAAPTAEIAQSLGAQIKTYPCDHHGLFVDDVDGQHAAILADQVAFIRSINKESA